MDIVKYCDNTADENIIADVLTIDNKELLLVSILETLCKLVDDKTQLFQKICDYLFNVGIIEDTKSYSE